MLPSPHGCFNGLVTLLGSYKWFAGKAGILVGLQIADELFNLRIAIDTGGTFTDCVYLDAGQLHVLKVRSQPGNPAKAVLECLRKIGELSKLELCHGTTVGTNAMLERKGARVAFITTAGFEDTIAIGRQARGRLYDWFQPAPICLAPEQLRFGVDERITAEGEVLRAPAETSVKRLAEQIRA